MLKVKLIPYLFELVPTPTGVIPLQDKSGILRSLTKTMARKCPGESGWDPVTATAGDRLTRHGRRLQCPALQTHERWDAQTEPAINVRAA
jgi:hypothetical protein